ncbi:MAG: rhomboid family intramembrane serine protease [Zymomonas mobilis]|uniref:Membrane associated rhomboid family serine protease n=1 Tax=Zymomonas mobilis TaxID=542 RepID=A0A542W2W6_ZYMMB|nr:rhomboid family intramembrane serine protease [Zymomonas mobilis]TQL17921.1 membrane associated rhomboid family serine protease [Zymomonas mobilis]
MRLPPARATTALVIVTSGVWLTSFLLKAQDLWAMKAGFIPARLHGWSSGVPSFPFWITPLSATFAHGGLMHIAFNMAMLAFCGRYVEMIIGSRKFLWLYVIGAYSSALSQYFCYPTSQDPMIGASGAISALFGAYAILFGREPQIFSTRWMNHGVQILWLAAAWSILQILIGISESPSLMLATAAHIGGFITGLICIRPLLYFHYHNKFKKYKM